MYFVAAVVVVAIAFAGILTLISAQAELTLTAVTFNIRMQTEDDGPNEWKHRTDLVYETIREMAPDVMGVQEAYASQLSDLEAALPDFARVGVGRDDGKDGGEHTAVFYNKNRFKKVADGTFWLSDTPHVVASNTWEAACNRTCTWITLSEIETGKTVSVYNVHYDHKSQRARNESPKVILQEMRKQEHHKHPLILMGDFNTGPHSGPMKSLFESEPPLRFHNTLTLSEEEAGQSATYSGWNGRTKGVQIDYVLVAGDKHEVLSGKIYRKSKDGRHPSDHYPVMAKIRFK